MSEGSDVGGRQVEGGVSDQPVDVRVANGLIALYGQTSGVEQDGSPGVGVRGDAADAGTGVVGKSAGGDGVLGSSASGQHAGVSAVNDAGGFGVWGRGSPAGHFETHVDTDGVNATSPGNAVVGISTGAQRSGVLGINDSGGTGVWGRGTVAGHFEGDVEVTGDIRLLGADCAEEFDVEEDVEPGWVVVLGRNGGLEASSKEFDKHVAGVVSGAGGLRPGIILGRRESTSGRVAIALLGRVYCWVDARYGPVEVGDLLTTSPTRGHAMRAADSSRAGGAVIGKALRRLAVGRDLIPILVALQ